jgi:small nuclear ribonucleoprotein (snRNP)-like protein
VTNVVVLNNHSHLKLRVHAHAAASLGDNQRFVAVVIGEFLALALHYPIFFSKEADTGRFYCGVMLGFDQNENLFLDEHRERQLYRPLNLQRGPFYTAGPDLAIDLDHPRVANSGDQALFDERGEPTGYLKSIIGLMNDLRPGLEQTRRFIDTLLDLRLVEPLLVNATFDDGSRREIEGLYTVSHEAMRALSDSQVVDLFRRGYLQLAYLQMASLTQVTELTRRKNLGFLRADGPR